MRVPVGKHTAQPRAPWLFPSEGCGGAVTGVPLLFGSLGEALLKQPEVRTLTFPEPLTWSAAACTSNQYVLPVHHDPSVPRQAHPNPLRVLMASLPTQPLHNALEYVTFTSVHTLQPNLNILNTSRPPLLSHITHTPDILHSEASLPHLHRKVK